MIPRTSATYTVIYDGDCAVCQRFIGYLRARDAEDALEIVAYQEDGVQARFPWIALPRFEEALQLVGPGAGRQDPGHAEGGSADDDTAAGATRRETWEGAGAIEQLVHVLPGGPRLGWVFRIPFARPLFAWGYRNFARNRRRFGCGEHCSMETAGD